MPVNLIAIGITGIYAAEAQLAAVQSNIANASNPNYSAESVTLQANAGYLGQGDGVNVLGTYRADAPLLTSQINATQAGQSYQQGFGQVVTLAQNYIAPSGGADLSQSLQAMFNAFSSLAASPSDPSIRTAAIRAAGNFAQAAGALSNNLQQTATNQLAQVGAVVGQVNNITQEIAALNSQIQGVTATSGSAAALLDQRDGLVGELASLIGAKGDAAGNVNINGVPLVSGTSALTLTTTGAGVGLGLQVTLSQGNLPLPTTQVGGQLGGIFAGAATTLQAQADLNTFATSAATSINTIHAAGYGLDGSTGNQLFQIPGAGGSLIALNPAINEQNLAASATAAGVPGDGSNASAIAALAAAPGLDASYPGATFGQAFAAIASDFGTTVNNAAADQNQAAATLQSLQSLKGSITGVSLNGQLANLVQYQSALEAAGRAVQAANDMINVLLQSISQ